MFYYIISGEIYNRSSDSTETLACLDLIPSNRPDWKVWCHGVNSAVKNHRFVHETIKGDNGTICMPPSLSLSESFDWFGLWC